MGAGKREGRGEGIRQQPPAAAGNVRTSHPHQSDSGKISCRLWPSTDCTQLRLVDQPLFWLETEVLEQWSTCQPSLFKALGSRTVLFMLQALRGQVAASNHEAFPESMKVPCPAHGAIASPQLESCRLQGLACPSPAVREFMTVACTVPEAFRICAARDSRLALQGIRWIQSKLALASVVGSIGARRMTDPFTVTLLSQILDKAAARESNAFKMASCGLRKALLVLQAIREKAA